MKKWFISIGVASILAVGIYVYASGINGNTSQNIPYEASAAGVSESVAKKGDVQDSSIPEVVFEANIIYTVDQDQIGDFADLVVLGAPQQAIEERQSDIRYFPKDPRDKSDTPLDIEYFQSFVKFKIDSVYKNATGINSGDEIVISERVALIEDAEGKKILKMDHYDELQAKQPYVLFLKKSPDSNIYYIVRDSDGQEKIAQGGDLEEQVQAILQKHKVYP